jgi:tetratricopeptide (TPR) repeat protein
MTLCCSGEWRRAVAGFDAAAADFDQRYAKSDWEATVAKTTTLFAFMQLGDFEELERHARRFLQEALHRGDLVLEVEAALNLALVSVARDHLEEARAWTARASSLWRPPSYTFQHWIALRVRSLTRLWVGQYDEALLEFEAEVRRAEHAGLTAMQVVRVEANETRGRALLGVANRSSAAERRQQLARVRRLIRALRREEHRLHALAPSHVLEAGVAWLEGRRGDAIGQLERAAALYARCEMQSHAAAAWLNIAQIRGSLALADEARETLLKNGVQRPETWARVQLPVELG